MLRAIPPWEQTARTYKGRPCYVSAVMRVRAAKKEWGFQSRVCVRYTDGQEPSFESVPAGQFNKVSKPLSPTEGR